MFRNLSESEDVRDGGIEAFIEKITILVHKHSGILLELKRMRESR